MYALLRGSIYFGFQVYGPWKSLVELRSRTEEDDLPINLVPPNKADISKEYGNVDEGEGPWIVIRGTLKKGFWFVGPLTEEDANRMKLNYDDVHGIMPLVTMEEPT